MKLDRSALPPRSWLQSATTRSGLVFVFLGMVSLMGGASRPDVASLVILRPAALVFATLALLVAPAGSFRRENAPLLFVIAAMALVASSLVPLPFELWRMLPGREAYATAIEALDVDPGWLAITLSPARTVNALAALTVPLAGALLVMLHPREFDRRLVYALLAVATASALLGLLQQLGNPRGPLYFYSVTNWGAPVGLFANRNHQAVFLAAMLPFLAHLALGSDKSRRAGTAILAAGVALLFILVIMIGGSRAGLIALALSLFVLIYAYWRSRPRPKAGTQATSPRRPGLVATGVAVVAVMVIALPTLYGRDLALERLAATSTDDETRFYLIPAFLDMVAAFFPIGSGYGTFELAFYQFETLEMLSRYYLNQAHNDWLQPVIEGGVFAVALIVLFLAWVGRTMLDIHRAQFDTRTSRRFAALSAVAILIVASLFDYPLRTPLAATVFVMCCVIAGRKARY